MKKLKTICGEIILVDDEDYERAKHYRWTVKVDGINKRNQVVTYAKREKHPYGVYEAGWYRGVTYKKLILGLNSKMTLFKNDNPLDLRKENIMIFNTRSEYVSARHKFYPNKKLDFNFKVSKGAQGKRPFGKKTKFKHIGVRCNSPEAAHPWSSVIKYRGENNYLGNYAKEEYAALAYDKKALEIFGPDATVNFPDLTLEEITKKPHRITPTRPYKTITS